MDRVQRQGQLNLIFSHRVIRRTARNEIFTPSLFGDALLFYRFGDHPDWIWRFTANLELGNRRGPVFTPQPNRQRDNHALSFPLLPRWKVIESHLRNVDYDSFIAALGKRPKRR